MVLFSGLVAGSFSLGVRVANRIDPLAITVARFVIAAGVLAGIVCLLPGRGRVRSLLSAPWRYLLLGGAFAGYFVLMFEGLKTAPAVAASAIFTLTPLMAAGFGWWLLRQPLTGALALALTVGGIGALCVIFRGDPDAMRRLEIGRGEAIYLLGCALHALYTPLVRKLNRGEGPLISALGTLVAGAILTAVWGWPALTQTAWAQLPAIVWIAIFYVAVFASAFSTMLVQYAALRLPAAQVMAYTYLTPLWVIGLEAGLGKGLPGIAVLPGMVAILAALALLLGSDLRARPS